MADNEEQGVLLTIRLRDLATGTFKDFQGTLAETSQKYKQLKDDAKAAGEAAEESAEAIEKAASKVHEETKKKSKETSKLFDTIKEIGKEVSNEVAGGWMSTIVKWGSIAGAAAGIAVTFKELVGAGIEVEHRLVRMGIQAGLTAAQLEDTRQRVNKVAQAYGESTEALTKVDALAHQAKYAEGDANAIENLQKAAALLHKTLGLTNEEVAELFIHLRRTDRFTGDVRGLSSEFVKLSQTARVDGKAIMAVAHDLGDLMDVIPQEMSNRVVPDLLAVGSIFKGLGGEVPGLMKAFKKTVSKEEGGLAESLLSSAFNSPDRARLAISQRNFTEILRGFARSAKKELGEGNAWLDMPATSLSRFGGMFSIEDLKILRNMKEEELDDLAEKAQSAALDSTAAEAAYLELMNSAAERWERSVNAAKSAWEETGTVIWDHVRPGVMELLTVSEEFAKSITNTIEMLRKESAEERRDRSLKQLRTGNISREDYNTLVESSLATGESVPPDERANFEAAAGKYDPSPSTIGIAGGLSRFEKLLQLDPGYGKGGGDDALQNTLFDLYKGSYQPLQSEPPIPQSAPDIGSPLIPPAAREGKPAGFMGTPSSPDVVAAIQQVAAILRSLEQRSGFLGGYDPRKDPVLLGVT